MSINVELLERTLAHIEAHPENWEQGTYRCATGMCFAGHAAVLCGGEWVHDDPDHWQSARMKANEHPAESAWSRAQRLLRISNQQVDWLFAADNTIEDLRRIVAEIKAGAA